MVAAPGRHHRDAAGGAISAWASLRAAYWVGLAAINGALAMALFTTRSRPNTWLMALLLGTLVLVMFGAAAMVTDDPRGRGGLAGTSGSPTCSSARRDQPEVDAYFNWPGFFALLALVSKTTGVGHLDRSSGHRS